MNALSIHYLGTLPERCSAVATLRERGQLKDDAARGITLVFRNSTAASMLMSADRGGHLLAALTRHRKNVPWVAFVQERELQSLRPWMRRLLAGADALVVPSDSARQAWEQALPQTKGRVFRVYPYLDGAAQPQENRVEARSPLRVRVGHSGRVRPNLGVVRSVFEAFVNRCPELRASLVLCSPGSFCGSDQEWASRLGIRLLSNKEDAGDLVVLVDDTSHDQAHDEALPLGFFQSMRSGKPLLSVGRNAEASRLLAHTGLGLHVDCTQHGWADRGAYVLQRAVFRRALKRGLLAEYAPRAVALAQFSTSSYCDQVEAICRHLLGEPQAMSAVQMAPEVGVAHALEQRLVE